MRNCVHWPFRRDDALTTDHICITGRDIDKHPWLDRGQFAVNQLTVCNGIRSGGSKQGNGRHRIGNPVPFQRVFGHGAIKRGTC